ncbi:hypothetical protein B0T16DRAFT_334069 [Cercophora newfieldiana]|uniref:Mid2 domain-containing protein n=1 Tax=Cercophora newfieldiana TaxID=92897 RepID=A0AA39XX47_9PEZI|nr:hypothetical protein B0T16DRAFT_334069 [Cercophora newfieldiana]
MKLSALIPCLLATVVGLASASVPAVVPALQTRNTPRSSSRQTLQHIARSLNAVKIHGRDSTFSSNKTVLDTSWSGATLLKQASGERKRAAEGSFDVEVICQQCYIKGAASASVTVKGDIGDTISNFTAEVANEVKNVTEAIFDSVGNFFESLVDDEDGIEFPTLENVDFDLDLQPLPGVSVKFEFEDDFELYMLLNTKLGAGATYTLNLYASKSPVGIAIGKDITAGVVVVIDLILDVNTAIEISSGFHLKLDKGVGFELNMFSPNVSKVDFPGGQFEFLPVTIVSEGVVLKGVLRVGLKIGLEVDTNGIASILTSPFDISAGVVAEVFANVAELITNVSGPALSSQPKPENTPCDLSVVEEYQFALGVAAGATVAVGFQTWGPVASESTPLFYTTLASACALRKPTAPVAPTGPTLSGSPTTMTAPALGARQAVPTPPRGPLTTVTTSTTLVFTAQSCKSSGLINCPASLQVSSTYKSTLTHITAVPSGVKPEIPLTKFSSVESAVPFGTGVHKMVESSGVPTSYVPGPTDVVGEIGSWLDGSTGTLGNKVLLGLVVGLGVPVLIGILAAVV